MKTNIQPTALALTPLTPIHIGCGLDFEPTNYVIDDGVLYHFEPARATLTKADRDALIAAVNRRGDEAIRDVQRFFHARRALFAGVAHGAVEVARGVAVQYDRRIGQVAQHESGGRRVTNLLEIERTAHHPHSGIAYVPGSSLKGAIRTAWLDFLNGGRGKEREERAQDIEKRLLNSRDGFHADPFRLIRVADAIGAHVQARIVFATNHKKRLVHDKDGRVVDAEGPAARRETITGGQHRALSGEIRFDTLCGIEDPRRTPAPANRIPGFTELAQACNRYYLPRLHNLLQTLSGRGFASPEWLGSMQKLLADLQPQLDAGHLMLLRVGRHSGAESVTLDGVRSIKIMGGRGQQPEYSSEGAKTVWLAAEHENERSGMLPFGWMIVEQAASGSIASLQAWCAKQPQSRIAAIRAELETARARAAAEAERTRQLDAERKAQAEAEAAEQAARAAAFAQLTPQEKEIATFVTACAAKDGRKDPLNPGNGLYAEALRLSKAALAEDTAWSDANRLQLADVLLEWLPKVIDKLDRKDDWKDARKKLRLAALRGE